MVPLKYSSPQVWYKKTEANQTYMIHDVPTDRRNRASKQCLGFSLPEHIFSKLSSINSGELIISPIYFPLKIPHLHIFLSARRRKKEVNHTYGMPVPIAGTGPLLSSLP